MPLPAGFKVNGSKVTNVNRLPIPPRVQSIMRLLDKLPTTELLTTYDLSISLGLGLSGSFTNHPLLRPYREKVDAKLFWGSPKSIAQLRKQLAEPEESDDQN